MFFNLYLCHVQAVGPDGHAQLLAFLIVDVRVGLTETHLLAAVADQPHTQYGSRNAGDFGLRGDIVALALGIARQDVE